LNKNFHSRRSLAAARFTPPLRQLVFMLAVMALFLIVAWLIHDDVWDVFLANPWLNGVIGLTFLIGILACFGQVLQLFSSVRWLRGFVERRPGYDAASAPRMLASLAGLLHQRADNAHISASSASSILESVDARIDEGRDIARYLANLLIFLGLLGTFYGLATTIPGVVETIKALAPKEGETAVQVFEKLMSGLELQLGGMGTAFSSSLLGLAGSLVVGLLELFAGHGQNRFYRELEEWLTSITRIGLSSGHESEGEGANGILVTVLDRMAARIEAQEERAAADTLSLTNALQAVAGTLRGLRDGREAELRGLLERIADGQDRMLEAMGHDNSMSADAESRMRLRSIDVQMLRLIEEVSAGRQESIAELRTEIAALTEVVRQSSRQQGGR